MRPNARGVSPFSKKGSAPKNTTNQLKESSGAKPIKNTIGMKPKGVSYSKIKGAVSG